MFLRQSQGAEGQAKDSDLIISVESQGMAETKSSDSTYLTSRCYCQKPIDSCHIVHGPNSLVQHANVQSCASGAYLALTGVNDQHSALFSSHSIFTVKCRIFILCSTGKDRCAYNEEFAAFDGDGSKCSDEFACL